MKIPIKEKVKPEFRESFRGKKFIRMTNNISNQPLTKWDTISLEDLENKNIMIFETRSHDNYSPAKKALFKKQRFYYEEEL